MRAEPENDETYVTSILGSLHLGRSQARTFLRYVINTSVSTSEQVRPHRNCHTCSEECDTLCEGVRK